MHNWSARSISNTCIDTREILDKGEHDIINYRLWKKSLKLLTYSSRTQYNLQCGQTGKSIECVFINVSDPVEG